MKFQTQYTFELERGEQNNGEKITVPHDAYTIREILNRFTSGGLPPIGGSVYYDDDPDSEQAPVDWSHVDPAYEPNWDSLIDTQNLKDDLAYAEYEREQERKRLEEQELLEKSPKPTPEAEPQPSESM